MSLWSLKKSYAIEMVKMVVDRGTGANTIHYLTKSGYPYMGFQLRHLRIGYEQRD